MNELIRRRAMMSKNSDEIIVTAGTQYEFRTVWLQKQYEDGRIKSPTQMTKREAKSIPSLAFNKGDISGDYSFFQYLTNVTNLKGGIGGSDYIYKTFIVIPPNVTSINELILYRFKSYNCHIVFINPIPPTSLSDKFVYYDDCTYSVYVPDVSYSQYEAKLSGAKNYCKGRVAIEPISELPDEEKAKIKVVDINTLIN